MIVFDASVLIAFLDGQHSHHRAAEALLIEAIDDDLLVNSLTLAEVLVAPVRENELDKVVAALHDVDIQEAPFPAATAVRLAELRAATGLKMPDCCVLLAAEDAAAGVATFDARLARAAAERNLPVLGT